MSVLDRSDLVWGAAVLLLLVLELAAVFGVAPWHTLTETSRLNERLHPWLRMAEVGFLWGLGVHMGWSVGLWRASLGGVLLAVATYYIW